MKAIEPCRASADQFLSPYFLVPKPDGSKRFILNLKCLNEFLPKEHFKMEDIRTATKLLSHNAFMASIDLKDAYYLVPLDRDSRRLVRFKFENQIYEFTCLVFGLSLSPWVFTKIMKPVLNALRLRGFVSTVYLDDFLCIGFSFSDCLKNVQATIDLLRSLGFVINEIKSNLQPSTRCKFLGFILDSVKLGLELTEQKKKSLSALVNRFLDRSGCRIREFAQLIGSLVAACPAVSYGWLYTKLLERRRFIVLGLNGGDFDQDMLIPEILKEDLIWWKDAIPSAFNPIKKSIYKVTIFSDASTTGWGASCDCNRTHGLWSIDERKLHINYLELLAVFLALKCFVSDQKDCEILLRVDNTTAISYINKMGGVQFSKHNKLARQIWQWCERRNIWIFASYIASKDNVIADQESRITNIDTEWELNNRAFESILSRFGKPDIDLFASRINKKCPVFCSWHRDPEAWVIDAFTLSWSNLFFYAFPPFALILKSLRKIVFDKAEGIMVVPNWPTQPWYPVFSSLLIEEPIFFRPSSNLLQTPCRSIEHPLALHLSLVAGRLSGRLSEEEMYRR